MDNFRDSYFNVTWDLTKKHLRGTFWGKQYDTGRGFAVTVINGGQVVSPTTEVLRLKWEKPDNTTGYVNATIVNGKFIVENIDQMFTVAGSIRADLELSVGGEFVASITFYVSVEKAVAVDAIESSSDFTALQEAIGTVDNIAQTIAGIDRTFGDRTFSTVAELQTAFPTGDTKRYVVASDGKWYWWNGTAWKAGQVAQAIGIADKSITPSKTNFFAESNLFNPETATIGGFLSSGTVYTNPSYFYSDYIPVKPGETILISGNVPSVGGCYDADRTFVSNIGREVDAAPNYTEVTIPNGVSYIRVNGFTGVFEDFVTTPIETFMVVKGTVFPSEYVEYNNGSPYIKNEFLKLDSLGNTPPINPLAGKILVTDGDSITQGSNPSGGFFKNYGELVADRYDMTFHNLAISGSTLSNVAGNNPFTGRWTNLPDTLDYLTLWFGWNDQAYSTLGAITDTVDTTFYGAWNVVLPQLITKYPKAKIGLIVPYLPAGKEAWQQAVRDVGIKWGLPVLDLMDKNTPLIWLRNDVDPTIAQLRRSTFTYDGTHLNQDGYNYMSTFVEDFIKSL